MLILLCIFFPPALIFVIPYYLLGNRNVGRQSVMVQRQTNQILKEAEINAFAAMTDEQQERVLDARRAIRKAQFNKQVNIWILIISCVGGYLFYGWLHGPYN